MAHATAECSACTGTAIAHAATECFVCTGTEGALLSDCCSCRDRHVHLACLQRLRACTPAHAHHCAVCLAPYRSGLGYFSLWARIRADSVEVALRSHVLLLQTLLLWWGRAAGCPLCPTLLLVQDCVLVGACLYAVIRPDSLAFATADGALWPAAGNPCGPSLCARPSAGCSARFAPAGPSCACKHAHPTWFVG